MGLRGTWVCTYCGKIKEGELPSPEGCSVNGTHIWVLKTEAFNRDVQFLLTWPIPEPSSI